MWMIYMSPFTYFELHYQTDYATLDCHRLAVFYPIVKDYYAAAVF